jgi:serine/threonine protein kinase
MDEYPIKIQNFDTTIWRRIMLIYQGIASHVYKIQHNENYSLAVLKTYSKKEEYSNKTLQRHNRYFYTEVECNKIMTETRYCVPLWYYYESQKEWGLITKYMSQLTLRSYIHLFPFSDIIIAKVVYPLLSAMYQLHLKGIIHRDLKPDNIFIDSDKIYIGDFGYSHVLDGNEKASGIVGTLQYMAPEILYSYLENDNCYEYGKEVDIWAIGIIVYEMFFYEKPFGWEEYKSSKIDIKMFVRYRLLEKLSFPSKIPDDAKDFIKKCLIVDPQKRPTIEVLLQHEWVLNYLKSKNDINEKCPQWSFSILALTAQFQVKNHMKKKTPGKCIIS